MDRTNRFRFKINHIGQIDPASVQVRTGNGHSVFSIGSMIIQGSLTIILRDSPIHICSTNKQQDIIP